MTKHRTVITDINLFKIRQHIGRRLMKIWTSEINHFIWILYVIHSWVDWISTPYCIVHRPMNASMIYKTAVEQLSGQVNDATNF